MQIGSRQVGTGKKDRCVCMLVGRLLGSGSG